MRERNQVLAHARLLRCRCYGAAACADGRPPLYTCARAMCDRDDDIVSCYLSLFWHVNMICCQCTPGKAVEHLLPANAVQWTELQIVRSISVKGCTTVALSTNCANNEAAPARFRASGVQACSSPRCWLVPGTAVHVTG